MCKGELPIRRGRIQKKNFDRARTTNICFNNTSMIQKTTELRTAYTKPAQRRNEKVAHVLFQEIN